MFRVIAFAALFAASPVFADGGPVPEEGPVPEVAPYPEAASAPAYEESNAGPYVALRAGAVFLNEEDIPGLIEYDTGFGVLASGGYAFESGIRVEGELGYRRLTGELPLAGVEETDNIFTFFANALYEFDAGYVKPYIGGGVGVAVVNAELASIFASVDDTGTSFAYQAIGGVAVPVSDQVDLVADYRFTGTSGLEVFGLDIDNEVHSVMGGVRVSF